jgi:hypothetical protein
VPSETNDANLCLEVQQEEDNFVGSFLLTVRFIVIANLLQVLEEPLPVPTPVTAEEIVFSSSKKSKKTKLKPKKNAHAEWPNEEV